jgi:hypothetical protein
MRSTQQDLRQTKILRNMGGLLIAGCLAPDHRNDGLLLSFASLRLLFPGQPLTRISHQSDEPSLAMRLF